MIRIDGKEIPEVQVFTYDVQEQVNNLNFQIVQLQGHLNTLRQQLTAKDGEIDALENQIAGLKQQLADCQANHPNPEPEPEPEPEPPSDIEYLINKSFAGVTIDPNPSKPSEKIFTQLDSAIKAVPYASYHNVVIMNGSVPNVAEVKEFNGKQALVTTLKSSTSSHSRVQSEIVVKQSASPDKIHSKFNMWIHTDYKNLEKLDKVVWVDIHECWFASPKERCSIYLDVHPNLKTLSFRWTSDVDDGSWTKRHPDQYSTKPIPLGQWIEFEVIWEKQTNRNRLLINGETFLDFIGKNDNKGPASYFQPLKHYVGSSVFNWMNSRGYEMTIAYADYKLIK